MPRYSYTAQSRSGERITGTADSSSLPALAASLQSQRQTLLCAREEIPRLPRVKGIPYFEITGIYRQIASSIAAGLPLAETLEMLSSESRNARLKSLLYFLKSQVAQGIPLSESMTRFPNVFPQVHIAVVKAGEESGRLGEALDELAEQAEALSNMSRRFASSLVYPSVIALFALALLNMTFIGIVPKFKILFVDLGIRDFPTVTRFVFFISSLVFPVMLLLGGATAVLVGTILAQRRAVSGRLWIDGWKLRLPIVGQIVEKAAFARFSGTLGLLLDSGVDLPRAVRLASEGAGNKTVERILKNLSAKVEMGDTLSRALDGTDAMPATLAWRIGVGEETGMLPDALLRMSRLYSKQVDSLVTSLSGMLEPLLIVVLGSGVAMLVVGMFIPVASVIQSLTGAAY